MLTVFISFTKKVVANDIYFLYLHLFQINFKNSEKKIFFGFFILIKNLAVLAKLLPTHL